MAARTAVHCGVDRAQAVGAWTAPASTAISSADAVETHNTRIRTRSRVEKRMAIARISEIVSSADSLEGAIAEGLKRANKTLRGVTGFEVTRIHGKIEKGKLKEYRVHMNVTFVLER